MTNVFKRIVSGEAMYNMKTKIHQGVVLFKCQVKSGAYKQ